MTSDKIQLYLIGTNGSNKNPLTPDTEGALRPSENAKGKNLAFGQDARASGAPLGVNTSLTLTFISSDSEPNLSSTDQKNALKNAIEAQQHAKEAIERLRQAKLVKRAVIEELQDKEDFREVDKREKAIIRIENNKVGVEPQYSDSRKLYYNAGKDNK